MHEKRGAYVGSVCEECGRRAKIRRVHEEHLRRGHAKSRNTRVMSTGKYQDHKQSEKHDIDE